VRFLLTSNRSAPFLAQPAGKQFIEKLWVEVVAEIAKRNPAVVKRLA
jgi:hypothetical protein